MPIGGDTWQSKTSVAVAENNSETTAEGNTYGKHGFVFDESFEGYVKIPYTQLVSSVGYINQYGVHSNKTIEYLYFRFKALGGSYADNVTVGPFFKVKSDSNSSKITFEDDKYKRETVQLNPIVGWERNLSMNISGVTAENVTPLSYTTEKGIKLTSTNSFVMDGNAEASTWQRYILQNPSDTTFSTDQTHLIIYVKTNKKANLFPYFKYSWAMAYLIDNAQYEVLEIGSNQWEEKTAVRLGKELEGKTYGSHGIYFDEAFEGYVKIPFNQFGGDIGYFNQYQDYQPATVEYMYMAVKEMGGDFADTITFGPYFTVNDTGSYEFTIDDKYKSEPIKVTPLSGYTNGTNEWYWVTGTQAPKLDWTSADSFNVKRAYKYGEDYDTDLWKDWANLGVYNSKVVREARFNTAIQLREGEGFLMYVNIPSANTIVPRFIAESTDPYSMKVGTTYYYRGLNDTEWKEGTFIDESGSGSNSYYGGMKFDSAFEGYVKFDVKNNSGITPTNDKIKTIRLHFSHIDEAGLDIGPFFMVTSDSPSPEIKQNTVLGDTNLDALLDKTDVSGVRGYILNGTSNKYLDKAGDLSGEGVIDILDLVKVNAYYKDFSFDVNTKFVTDGELSENVLKLETELYLPETAYGKGGVILTNSAADGENAISFEIGANGNPYLYLKNSETENKLTFDECDVRTGDFAKLTFEIDNSAKTVSVYLDGALKDTKSFTGDAAQSAKTFAIGGDLSNENTNFFKGKIRNISLYGTGAAPFASYDLTKAVAGDDLAASVGDVKLLGYAYLFSTNTLENPDYAYSFAIVGDPQTLLSNNPEKVAGIYKWIAANKDLKNIQHTVILGDVTDNNSAEQWQTSVRAMANLGDMTYSVVRGNHDGYNELNTYLATEKYLGSGVVCKTDGDINNSYTLKTIGEHKYMFLNLEFGAYDDVLGWANEVVAAHLDYKVIVTTHSYLNSNGSVLQNGVYPDATTYTYSEGDIDTKNDSEWATKANSGQNMFDELIKKHENIVMVLSGHVGTDKVVVSEATGEKGNKITQILIDAQDADGMYDGGLGMVAMFYVSEDGNSIEIEYYSTVNGKYLLRQNQKTISLN